MDDILIDDYYFVNNTMDDRARHSSRWGNTDLELTREELQKLIDGECLVIWDNYEYTVQITVKKE